MDAASRIRMLETFIEQNPADPFPRYSLALECTSSGDDARAGTLFADLVRDQPQYVATYLMYGNFLTRRGDLEQARDIFTRGISAARTAGDGHAASELKAALAELPESS